MSSVFTLLVYIYIHLHSFTLFYTYPIGTLLFDGYLALPRIPLADLCPSMGLGGGGMLLNPAEAAPSL